jgi:RNA-directed DNA polymerase
MKVEETHITEIKSRFSNIETKEDLLNLLNYARTVLYGEDCQFFKMNQLTYYADPSKCSNRYEKFIIKKKSGGERQINSPVKGLKSILKALNFVLQCCFEPHKSANGFVLNKSIVTNASKHLGKNYVYNIDLKDFFHSFDRKRVKVALMQAPFHFKGKKEPLAFLIASLCTHPLDIDGKLKNVLPQGSPTSPALTNLLCNRLDRRLNGLAKKLGASYTRYADDITFSSNQNLFKEATFQSELKRIIETDQLLLINPKKTRLQMPKHRQEVTGLTVNTKPNVPTRYIKQIRMWIYYWEKYGYFRAQQLFTNDYRKDKGHIIKGQPNLVNVLSGKLDFLKMVKGEKDTTYLNLMKRFEILNGIKPMNKENEVKIDDVLNILFSSGLSKAMDVYRKMKK